MLALRDLITDATTTTTPTMTPSTPATSTIAKNAGISCEVLASAYDAALVPTSTAHIEWLQQLTSSDDWYLRSALFLARTNDILTKDNHLSSPSSSPSTTADTKMMPASTTSTAASPIALLREHAALFQLRVDFLRDELTQYRFGKTSSRPIREIELELESVKQEQSILLLLLHLTAAEEEHATAASGAFGDSNKLFSDRNKIIELTRTHPHLLRYLKVVDWLEALAEPDTHIDVVSQVSFRRTLRQHQLQPTSSDVSLDPDTELRENKMIFTELDREEEAVFLRNLWSLIRAGKMQDAIELCHATNQHWRALSISGGRFWHDERGCGEGADVSGNPFRELWKESCRRLATQPQASTIEKSIYGALAGELQSTLASCRTWEDTLWAYFRHAIDRIVDAYMRDQLLHAEEVRRINARLTRPSVDRAFISSADDVFRHARDPSNSLISALAKTQQARVYAQLQQHLILAQYPQAIEFIVSRVSDCFGDVPRIMSRTTVHELCANASQPLSHSTSSPPLPLAVSPFASSGSPFSVSPFSASPFLQPSSSSTSPEQVTDSLLLFSVHLVVLLFGAREAAQRTHLDAPREFLLRALLGWLIRHQRFEAVPAYIRFFPSADDRVELYTAFLSHLPTLTDQLAYLALARRVFAADATRITHTFVQYVFAAQAPTLPSSYDVCARGDSGVAWERSPLALGGDVREWHSVWRQAADPAASTSTNVSVPERIMIQVLDAFDVAHTNDPKQVLHAVQAANTLFREFASRHRVASLLALHDALTASRLVQFALIHFADGELQWHVAMHELDCWSAFVRCMMWFEAWCRADVPVSSHANAAVDPLDSRMSIGAASEKEFLRLLQMQPAWLDMLPAWANAIDAAQQQQLNTLRQHWVPRLVLMLHHILRTTEPAACLQLADLVADPRYKLHDAFGQEELRVVLRALADVYVRVQMYDDQFPPLSASSVALGMANASLLWTSPMSLAAAASSNEAMRSGSADQEERGERGEAANAMDTKASSSSGVAWWWRWRSPSSSLSHATSSSDTTTITATPTLRIDPTQHRAAQSMLLH